ncbi:LysR family transcriptional regulator [Lentilactobacillus senioris]|uniref:LysR family transcriptional regulator n=1 Tax=Lentilactobacillus senioris TaxID=931534 RepID=UPI00227FB8E8|nr:LysR family transcriptional regulator [Lentilactobacillus senioris]MCY9806154.1 LysR family transcriptional regulator [Lentilactobacillus senioris]
MDTKKIAAFINLARTKNYTKTAEQTFTTQATVSKQIIALEKEWGVKLFSRDHRKVELTETGKAILPLAQEMLHQEQKIITELHNQLAQQQNTLVIQAIPTVAQYRAFVIVAEFMQLHPEINLKFNEVDAPTKQPADIFFTRILEPADDEYDVIVEDQDFWVALVPQNNPLAQLKQLTLSQLNQEKFLLLDPFTRFYEPVVKELQAAGIKPDTVYEGRRIDLILKMINQGMGISILMNNSFDLTNYPNVKILPIEPKKYSWVAFLKLRSNHSLAAEKFWQFAKQKYSEF